MAILGWGYTPPPRVDSTHPQPSPERRNGTHHEAVLVIARVDDPDNVPFTLGPGSNVGEVKLGPEGQWLFILGFNNMPASVDFRRRDANRDAFGFWQPGGDYGSDVRKSNVTTGEVPATISFLASVSNPSGGQQPVNWLRKRINPELWMFCAGFKPGETPQTNLTCKAVLFVVSMGDCPSEDAQNALRFNNQS